MVLAVLETLLKTSWPIGVLSKMKVSKVMGTDLKGGI